jgi:hypothetical protein
MVKRGALLAEQGHKDRATKLLSAAAQISNRTGNRKATKLIQDALQEYDATGSLSRGTVIGMADQARKTKLMPEEEMED